PPSRRNFYPWSVRRQWLMSWAGACNWPRADWLGAPPSNRRQRQRDTSRRLPSAGHSATPPALVRGYGDAAACDWRSARVAGRDGGAGADACRVQVSAQSALARWQLSLKGEHGAEPVA